MILYRPVGFEELLLIYRAGLKQFPPRLPEQPIFYPVLDEGYARQIARDWNAPGSGAGYVTVFEVDDEYVKSFEVRQVGAREHQELWVPAGSLGEFNAHVLGLIRLVAAYFGPDFVGSVPKAFSLRGKDANAQFEALRGIHQYNLMDFHGEITANHEAVFAHFPYWEQCASAVTPRDSESPDLLSEIRRVWERAFPAVPLGIQA
ncbi:hypothetical protein D7V97_18535 [Corallococcus sp. CA053C]|uniref:hypothetical protein n=1 Tax=Corallococcus sp. CA053C TaxID=2316732 RepID=UPI000EA1B731|nr:hypothetical protein [Corallococcus sp. CA053C]RKH08749.1 hypothetical protein D7V97_18535 [Corallococcus sp. CA053C]